MTELIILPARYFSRTVGKVVESQSFMFEPVSGRKAILKVDRNKQELETAVNFARSKLSFFQQLPAHAIEMTLKKGVTKKGVGCISRSWYVACRLVSSVADPPY